MNVRILFALSIACFSALSLNAFTIENNLQESVHITLIKEHKEEKSQEIIAGQSKHFDLNQRKSPFEYVYDLAAFVYNKDFSKVYNFSIIQQHKSGGKNIVSFEEVDKTGLSKKSIFYHEFNKNIKGIKLISGEKEGSITIKPIE